VANWNLLRRPIRIVGGTSLTPAYLSGQIADIIADPRYRSGVACGVPIEDVPVGLDP
jgi:hypothetical protein